MAPFKPPLLERRPGLFRGCYTAALGGQKVLGALCWVDHSDPTLDFFNEKTEGLLDTRIFTTISNDGGQAWSKPRLMDTYPLRKPLPLTGPVLVAAGGKWACQFEVNKHYDDPRPWRHASMLAFSHDRGRTWREFVVVANDPANRYFYWDQRPACMEKNRLLNLFWTFDNKKAVYLNIHAGVSLDNGRTWSELWDTGVPGQPAAPVPLGGRKVAMVYMDRTGAPTVKARLSTDGGRTWPVKTEVILFAPPAPGQTRSKNNMKDAWSEMAKFSTGLPATAALPGGDFLVVFYTGPEPDKTDIRWMRVRP